MRNPTFMSGHQIKRSTSSERRVHNARHTREFLQNLLRSQFRGGFCLDFNRDTFHGELTAFRWGALCRDWPRNDRSMNWLEFRLTQNAVNYINNQGATYFRATCDFEEDAFDINTDYPRGEISNMNFFSGGCDITETCIEYERVRIFGVGCDDCTAETWHAPGYHVHIEDNSCDLQVAITHYGSRREYFGYFQAINNNHACASSSGATTQWWLGVKLQQQQEQGRR